MNGLIYGESGVGKTSLLATAQDSERGSNLLIIDFEGGSRSISDRADISIFQPKSFAEVGELYEWLVRDEHGFKTVAIDSLTEAQRIGMGEVMRSAKNPDLPSLQDYGKSNEKIMKIIRSFRPLAQSRGINVLFTALQTEKTTPAGVTTYGPALSPKAAEGVVGVVDLVGHLTVDRTGKRTLNLRSTSNSVAKVRQPKGENRRFPDVIVDPTFGKLFDLAAQATLHIEAPAIPVAELPPHVERISDHNAS